MMETTLESCDALHLKRCLRPGRVIKSSKKESYKSSALDFENL